jgi:GntR family transcriptional repressor for pyruvate dehydrogenase complex
MKLDAIKRQNTMEATVEAISSYILDNGLKAGDFLPPEMDLAAQLGISRNILREALRHFRTLGILDSRPKKGTFITALMPQDPYAGFRPFIEARKNAYRELIQARRTIELGAIPEIISQATEDDIIKLDNLAKEMAEQPEALDCTILDIEFHSALIKMAHNRILESMIPLTVEFFENNKSFRKHTKTRKDTATIALQHHTITNAIANKNEEELRKAIMEHYADYFNNK